ncbi:MAG: cysteine--tRNA ligase [Bacillus subtilis]|nr:cysteine--tRNA ligase [Bacillus subtilis]
MKLFNSYTNTLETFVPHHPNQVSIYVCGPTVYNYIHIGNARPVVFFDVVRRYFEAKGYAVKFASNFTDVDDKIIEKANATGKTALEVANDYIAAFLNDVKNLGSHTDYIQPRVTEYIQEIIDYIASLIRLGYAYEVAGDVYFRVAKIAEYGHLSNRKIEDLISGSRVEINPLKENPLDFTLWKKTTDGINWESPFSKGRPGWHTECVAMIDDIFGEEIDIHGGGTDLLFPHHENEIAQSLACHGHTASRYWLHNGRLNIDGAKMSKSEGKVIFVKDLNADYRGFRMFLLSTHYRSPINYSDDSLDVYVKEWQRLEKIVQTLYRKLDLADAFQLDVEIVDPQLVQIIAEFDQQMDLDFNTPNALTCLNQLFKLTNQWLRQPANYGRWNQALKTFERFLGILGLEPKLVKLTDADHDLISRWEAARTNKDFALADTLRQELAAKDLL